MSEQESIIQGETRPAERVFRPAILPDDIWLFKWVLYLELASLGLGFFFHSVPWIVGSLVAAGLLPGLPILIHTLFFLVIRMSVFHDRVEDFEWVAKFGIPYLLMPVIERPMRQEMLIKDIHYVYRLQKEAVLLRHLRSVLKLAKVKVPGSERDYSWENLSRKYGVPPSLFEEYGLKYQKEFEDKTPLQVYLKTALHLQRFFSEASSWHAGAQGYAKRILLTVVLSNQDGTRKVYLPHFYDLSVHDQAEFLALLTQKNPKIQNSVEIDVEAYAPPKFRKK